MKLAQRPIATRNGEPAYLRAPQRLRQSDIDRLRQDDARGIDTRRAETGTGLVHESPARKGLAQTPGAISVARLDENREQGQ